MNTQKLLYDIKTDILDEVDLNFRRKAFFDKPCTAAKFKKSKGSLLINSAALKNSLKATIQGNSIIFSSPLPYAKIHNEGGEIIITQKAKKYFWYRYIKLVGKSKKVKGKKQQQAISQEALQWKFLALKKVGSKIKIPKRQFIGWNHPTMIARIDTICHNFITRSIQPPKQ